MFEKLLPREAFFFDYFDEHISLAIQVSECLFDLANTGQDIHAKAVKIKTLEHEADNVTHKCIEALHKTFITPFDRESIFNLISRLDDIIDGCNAAAGRVQLYHLTEMTEEFKQMARILVDATKKLKEAITLLRDLGNGERIRLICKETHTLENEGDDLLRKALSNLFDHESNVLTIIKWKEVYEHLEVATDRCEDAANIIEGIILENA